MEHGSQTDEALGLEPLECRGCRLATLLGPET
jgi:hypothetical protein